MPAIPCLTPDSILIVQYTCQMALQGQLHLRTCRPHYYRKSQVWHQDVRAAAACTQERNVMVLDFDGVVVDSAKEVAYSALLSAQERWPTQLSNLSTAQLDIVMKRMSDVRPVLVRGYESMVQLRLLCEDASQQQVDRILDHWSHMLPESLGRWQESEQELTELFERNRNNWMRNEPAAWMARQPPYPGVVDALHACPFPVYFATSKAGHRVSALMQAQLGYHLPVDDPRLMAALLPPEPAKAQALRDISARHRKNTAEQPLTTSLPLEQPVTTSVSVTGELSSREHNTSTQVAAQEAVLTTEQDRYDGGNELVIHFVEDRLDTLRAIAEDPQMAHVKLYLASWGYCTPSELKEAKHDPRVTVIDLPQFCSLLCHGHLGAQN